MSRFYRNNPEEPIRHDWLEGGVHVIDPAVLRFCPCGRQLQGDYFVCRPCWLSAPAYFRIKFSDQSQFRKEQARNQILNFARRRGEKKELTQNDNKRLV